MTQVDFYHLQKQSLENVLPKLLEKAYATGKPIKVKVGNEERVEFINSALWSYDEQSFLPHGSKKDGFGEDQPIWISVGDDTPNQAVFLFLVDGAAVSLDMLSQYERVFNIFDGNSEAALNQARTFWKELKTSSNTINYWQQDDAGKWNKKA